MCSPSFGSFEINLLLGTNELTSRARFAAIQNLRLNRSVQLLPFFYKPLHSRVHVWRAHQAACTMQRERQRLKLRSVSLAAPAPLLEWTFPLRRFISIFG